MNKQPVLDVAWSICKLSSLPTETEYLVPRIVSTLFAKQKGRRLVFNRLWDHVDPEGPS